VRSRVGENLVLNLRSNNIFQVASTTCGSAVLMAGAPVMMNVGVVNNLRCISGRTHLNLIRFESFLSTMMWVQDSQNIVLSFIPQYQMISLCSKDDP
jgi:hypothetical protein